MRLTLSVLTLQDQPPFTSMTYSFDQSGGSVGRHQRANWVLLDDKKFLSGEHFTINCDGKDFFVVDTSTNGTFINDSIHPLGKDNSHRLTEKDRIRIGEYVIISSISTESIAPQSDFPVSNHSDSFSNNSPHDPFFSSGGHFDSSAKPDSHDNNLQAHDPYAGSSKSSFVDPNMSGTFGQASAIEDSSDPFFSSDESFTPHEVPFNRELDENIMEADNPLDIHSPLVISPASASPTRKPVQVPAEVFKDLAEENEPDAFDFLDSKDPENPKNESDTEQTSIEVATPTKEINTKVVNTKTAEIVNTELNDKPPSKKKIPTKKEETEIEKPTVSKDKDTPSTSNSEALKMLLKGAGITQKHLPSEVPNETFEIIGHALKEVLQGTIDLLRARAETKNHLHLDRTIIGRVENNPLKFMPNAEQVIVHLLTTEDTNKTYTPLDRALEEAFDDIKAHQFAMTVATQNALRGVIKQHFSPKNLADNMAREHPISSKIPLQRQAKLWNMFESLYDNVEKEAAESFQTLLDNEVSSAYEKQLMELKSLRISSNNTNSSNNNDFPE